MAAGAALQGQRPFSQPPGGVATRALPTPREAAAVAYHLLPLQLHPGGSQRLSPVPVVPRAKKQPMAGSASSYRPRGSVADARVENYGGLGGPSSRQRQALVLPLPKQARVVYVYSAPCSAQTKR